MASISKMAFIGSTDGSIVSYHLMQAVFQNTTMTIVIYFVLIRKLTHIHIAHNPMSKNDFSKWNARK